MIAAVLAIWITVAHGFLVGDTPLPPPAPVAEAPAVEGGFQWVQEGLRLTKVYE